MYNLIPNLTVRENIEVGAYLGDDLQNVLTQIRALKEADGAYQSFSGLKEGQSGSVRFIIETDEISKYEEAMKTGKLVWDEDCVKKCIKGE